MSNPEHVAVLKQGVDAWNRWRGRNKVFSPDLSSLDLDELKAPGINLNNTNLNKATLRSANLSGADLSWANLIDANLSRAELGASDLQEAYLVNASLRRSDLTNANLRRTHLSEVDLSLAVLAGTDFTKSLMSRVLFCEVDLKNTKGLQSVDHARGSTVDLSTLRLSNFQIPDVFLRGVGLPERFIEYSRSLAGNPIEFYSIFISYSAKDQLFADRLYADLQANGVRCWFAAHDMKGGRKIYEQIDEAIRVYDRLLLILSDSSMNSEWVKTEMANAREREVRERRQMLFPITLVPFDQIRRWKALDADTGKDSAREVREYFIPDFSNWRDHDTYQNAFEKLLKGLKSEGSTSPAT